MYRENFIKVPTNGSKNFADKDVDYLWKRYIYIYKISKNKIAILILKVTIHVGSGNERFNRRFFIRRKVHAFV